MRRIRYSGRNPRNFADKYKELAPERYAADVAKVVAAGKTPAGTHRPIMVAEVLEVLAPQPGDLAMDCTLGYGGHARAILQAITPGGRLIGLDVDPIELPRTDQRLRELGFGSEVFTSHLANFASLGRFLPESANLILADLGLSSMQIDNPGRGFTYKVEGPLDLRMNPQRGQSASNLLAGMDIAKLAAILENNADQPDAERVASAILQSPVTTTTCLAAAVRRGGGSDDDIRRVFQALRIEVNDEFGVLEAFLRNLPFCLKPGGRVAILSFHSGEDRRVKASFKEGLGAGIYCEIADKVLRPTRQEVHSNPRSSSAKLRWAKLL